MSLLHFHNVGSIPCHYVASWRPGDQEACSLSSQGSVQPQQAVQTRILQPMSRDLRLGMPVARPTLARETECSDELNIGHVTHRPEVQLACSPRAV